MLPQYTVYLQDVSLTVYAGALIGCGLVTRIVVHTVVHITALAYELVKGI